MNIAGIALVVIAIVLLFVFLLHGEKNVSIESDNDSNSSLLSCYKDNANYAFLNTNNTLSKKARVDIIFNNDSAKTFSLKYDMQFSSIDLVSSSDANNRFIIGEYFARDGLAFDALGISFSNYDKNLLFILFANRNEINSISKKYFYMKNLAENSTAKQYEEYFINQDFECVLSNNYKE